MKPLRLSDDDRARLNEFQWWRTMMQQAGFDPDLLLGQPLLSCERRAKLDWKYVAEGRGWADKVIRDSIPDTQEA